MWTRFQTLMLREWMQHKRGWLLVMLVPPAIFLAIMPFGNIEVPEHLPVSVIAALALFLSTVAIGGISWGAAMLQLPGLARRDRQDRSIEFWLSLPAGHSESLAATLLMHVLLVPLLALLVGASLGFVISAAVTVKLSGLAALAEVSWAALLVAGLAGLARLALGLVLTSLWLSPLFMVLMAASAWLKRWGVPAVIGTVVIGGNVLARVYDNPIVWKLLEAQLSGAAMAVTHHEGQLDSLRPDSVAEFGGGVARWALQDSLAALQNLASPHLLGGLLVAAACFGLLVLRRRRS